MSVASCYNEAIDKKSFLIVGPIAGLGLGFIVSPSPDIFTGLVIGVVGAMVGLAAGVGIYYGGATRAVAGFSGAHSVADSLTGSVRSSSMRVYSTPVALSL